MNNYCYGLGSQACKQPYQSYGSHSEQFHLSYDQLFYTKKKKNINLYSTGRINTQPKLRELQGLDNQTLANVCIIKTNANVCNSKNLYPLQNTTCTSSPVNSCQTSDFNSNV